VAGIGFELRKLFKEQGLINNVRAYAYSSLTTVGPMLLCMFLIVALQKLLSSGTDSYMEWQLYIATVAYCFIFSIVFTSAITMLITRYVADMLYEKKYNRLMSSYYGTLMLTLPIVSLIAIWFLSGVNASFLYKFVAYLMFMLLVMIWIQGVYLSALKDYMRITKSFIIGALLALLTGWILMSFSDLPGTTAAIIAFDIGFFIVVLLTNLHFVQKFPKGDSKFYFEYISYFKKYPSLFFTGFFIYSGVYVHNFVYWLGPRGEMIAGQFKLMPFYDLPVFYAFLSVVPTLIMFVVSVETSFYEKFRIYYLNILNGGTIQDITTAKKSMQKVLIKESSFLMEVQLLFTIFSIALGIKFLPKIGFTMAQLDLFLILALGYFLFIIFFVLAHILMYFDDRKGVLWVGVSFIILNIGLSYMMMSIEYDGLGMFIASFISLIIVIIRLLYVLRNIDYFTFCAQPLHQVSKQKLQRTSPLVKAGSTFLGMLLIVGLLSACSISEINVKEDNTNVQGVNRLVTESEPYRIKEDKRIYNRDEDGSLKTLYVTILPSKKHEALDNWYQMNRSESKDDKKVLEAIVQEGFSDGKGPRSGLFGYGATMANATISLRGNTAWYFSQKSYAIKLKPDAGTYLDQERLNLNKHMSDHSRIRNKLSFDLFETIPDITSLRTQFVHMYVKDLSEGMDSDEYVDYGLFTHVEQPNKKFLKAHLLDPNGFLYKVIHFEFLRYEDNIKNIDDEDYDVAKFEEILEIKGRKDHAKLIAMIDDVNDYSISIDEVMEKHFDLDNFLTWTAANILMDNMDTNSNNFFLYSPLNIDKWYFFPWDYDGGWDLERLELNIRPYQTGISNYWGSVLHNRYFRTEQHVNQLIEKLEELTQYINKETIQAQIDKYKPTVKPFLEHTPDIHFLPNYLKNYDADLEMIVNGPEHALKLFYEDLEKPKPFWISDVEQLRDALQLGWEMSFDLQDDKLFYDVSVSKDASMNEIVFEENDVVNNSLTMPLLPQGIYYLKVMARDAKGNSQYAFDAYYDDNKEYFNGIRQFEVN